MNRPATRYLLTGLFVLAAFWIGTAYHPESALHAQVKRVGPTEAFQAGDQLALPVLQKILATLRRIDERLERFEKLAQADPEK